MFLYESINILSRIFGKVSRILRTLATSFEPADIQERVVSSSTRYDMVKASDEPYYASQYCKLIEPHLPSSNDSTTIYDLGCSQGRFSILMAAALPKGKVIGCDLSDDAIAKAITS